MAVAMTEIAKEAKEAIAGLLRLRDHLRKGKADLAKIQEIDAQLRLAGHDESDDAPASKSPKARSEAQKSKADDSKKPASASDANVKSDDAELDAGGKKSGDFTIAAPPAGEAAPPAGDAAPKGRTAAEKSKT